MNKLFYVGSVATTLAMLVQMWVYGWNESWFYYFFPFNVMQPLRIHYVTVIVCVAIMIFSTSIYRDIEFLRSFTLSSLLVLMDLSGFELIWHIGRGFGYGVGPGFWLMYLLLAFLCFTYTQWRWAKHKMSVKNALLYLAFLFGFLLFWLYYDKVFAFYPALLLYDAHNGPNPHTVGFFIFKAIVLSSPLTLIRRGKRR